MLLKKLKACTCSNPNYDHASSLFPQNDVYPGEATWETRTTPFLKTDVCATRRFVLDAPAISKLNAKATSSSMQNPTRVEVVSALISYFADRCSKFATKNQAITRTKIHGKFDSDGGNSDQGFINFCEVNKHEIGTYSGAKERITIRSWCRDLVFMMLTLDGESLFGQASLVGLTFPPFPLDARDIILMGSKPGRTCTRKI
ncbi:hypothetical protein WN944_008955 [Citrus x changshan-huyou]|uniref:Uncharacterized protein n=1 Tax=Citrus x changshan-huyou TaxID=2935761 RepID=A0AAP0QRN8_9ROSI